jgi:hypothetical protein
MELHQNIPENAICMTTSKVQEAQQRVRGDTNLARIHTCTTINGSHFWSALCTSVYGPFIASISMKTSAQRLQDIHRRVPKAPGRQNQSGSYPRTLPPSLFAFHHRFERHAGRTQNTIDSSRISFKTPYQSRIHHSSARSPTATPTPRPGRHL